MKEQVVERKAYVNAGGVVQASDAFSMLVEASENEEAKYKMDDTELVSACIQKTYIRLIKLPCLGVDRQRLYYAFCGTW